MSKTRNVKTYLVEDSVTYMHYHTHQSTDRNESKKVY